MMRTTRRNFAKDRSGTIAVTGALSMAALLASIGMAITYASAAHEKSMHQKALDAAVLAGASASASATDVERIALAQRIFDANLTKSAGSTSNPPSIQTAAAAPNFNVQHQIVTGRSSTEVKNFFSGIIGNATVPVVAESAAQSAISAPVCVLALDRSNPQGFEVFGTAQFTARNCAAQSNSGDGLGMRQYGSGIGKARQFGVTGGFSGEGFVPRPVAGVAPLADPYALLPVPAAGACVDIAAKLQHTPAILTPGTYCGGIRIMAGSTIIMQPGVYLMQDGPFRIDSNSTVTGQEVVIAFTGTNSTLYLGSGAVVNLTSPVSGPYTNIQFFQDRLSNVDGWVTMLGDIRLTFDGVMYFPTQHVWISGGSTIEAKSPTYIFVAEKLWFQDNSIVEVWQENSRNLDVAETAGHMVVGAHLTK